MARTTFRRRAALVAMAASATVAVAPAALATFPGDNGLIAFQRGGDIYTVNPDGTGERQLTSSPAVDSNPEWAPNGREIYFERDGGVYRMLADGSDVTRILKGNHPQISPDGRHIAYQDGETIKAIDLFDANNEDEVAQEPILTEVNDWSPTSSLILYSVDDGDTAFAAQSAPGIFIGYGGILHDDRHLNRQDPSFSPNGAQIAFHTSFSALSPCWQDPTCPPEPELGLATMDIGGGDRKVIHPRGRQPAWSPDGERIAYVNGDTIQVIRTDGTGRKTLVKGARPDWQPLEPKPPEPEVRVVEVPGSERIVKVPVPGPERVVEKVVTRTVRGAAEKCDVNGTRFTLVLRAHKSIRAGMGFKVTVDIDTKKAKVSKGKKIGLKAGVR